MLNDMFGTLS